MAWDFSFYFVVISEPKGKEIKFFRCGQVMGNVIE